MIIEEGEEIGVFDKEGYEIDTFEVLEEVKITSEKLL